MKKKENLVNENNRVKVEEVIESEQGVDSGENEEILIGLMEKMGHHLPERTEGRILYTVREVSEATGIPLSTLYRHIRKGKIRVLRNPFGRGTLIYFEELKKLEQVAQFYQGKRKVENDCLTHLGLPKGLPD